MFGGRKKTTTTTAKKATPPLSLLLFAWLLNPSLSLPALKTTRGKKERLREMSILLNLRRRRRRSRFSLVPTSSSLLTVSLHCGILETKFEVVGLLRSSRTSRTKSRAEMRPGIVMASTSHYLAEEAETSVALAHMFVFLPL